MSLSKTKLINRVYQANLLLPKYNLVTFTWGNVSEIDREQGIIAIKPSGVDYEKMRIEDIVITDLKGNTIEGDLKPSSDLDTHVELYQAFPDIKAVVHTHSSYATIYAQAHRDINCLGTTHADTFYGNVFCTRLLTAKEIGKDYERNTGKVIIEEYCKRGINPNQLPGVLVASHGPFVWGDDAIKAVENAKVLEEVARMNYFTEKLNPQISQIQTELLDKHFLRKHGKNAYYGQKK